MPAETTRTARVAGIVRWAARLTSLPIFGLLLVSLIPALTSFGISAKDDRIITVGMCSAALGFILGWLWPGIGGLLVGIGVAVMGSQEGSVLADPFTVAFGLQGVLFLISSALNSPWGKATAPQMTRFKAAALAVLVLFAVAGAVVIYRGPGPTPVPKEKEMYVGTWDSLTGFKLQITPEGRAEVSQDKDAKVAPCNTPVNGAAQASFLATFRGDDRLELASGPLQSTKIYHIDRHPFHDHEQVKMILNGSDPYQRTNGIMLVKQTAGSKPSPGVSGH